VPRAAAQRITSRESFARRVAIVYSGPEVWRADPHALWNVVVSTFGQRHEIRKMQRVQKFMLGFSPLAGDTIYAYLDRFEREIAAIEVESPNTLGAELALPLYLQTSLKHIPQCAAVFARMLGKDNRPYAKYKRYLFNSYEDVHFGKWTLKSIPGRNSAEPSIEQLAPSSVAVRRQVRNLRRQRRPSRARVKKLATMPRREVRQFANVIIAASLAA
jgi:hypothetical protein